MPTVSDQASAHQLNSSAQHLGASLGDLRSAVTRAREACGGLELDAASDLVASLRDELDAFRRAVENAELRPLPGETVCTFRIQNLIKFKIYFGIRVV